MVISANRLGPVLSARATKVFFSESDIVVSLEDGRCISAPIVWFPRLAEASERQRNSRRRVGRGVGARWGELGEDIAVEGLLATRDDVLRPAAYERAAPPRTPEDAT